jgi:hypothetical protein
MGEAPLDVEYARRAWDKPTASWVDIKIAHMSLTDARYWETYIQPEIRRIANDEISKGLPLTRADHRWPWVQMRAGLPVAQWMAGRRCRALTIHLQDNSGNTVPAAMLLLIEEYPWLLQRARWLREAFNFTKQSTFTWFLTSAPKTALRQRGVLKTPSLLRILIDTALVTSMNLGLKGRMWLHAAPGRGQLVVRFLLGKVQIEACR